MIADDDIRAFCQALGGAEEPLGLFYADTPPEDATMPPESGWSCMVGRLAATRRKGKPAAFSASRNGCPGAAYFLGFQIPLASFLPEYISKGEGYLDSPAAAADFYAKVDSRPAPRPWCVVKRLADCGPEDKAELVLFFGRPEIVSGLHQLAAYVTCDTEAVASPFGSGCANLMAWPLNHLGRGRLKLVLGGWDPSCRPFLGLEELTASMPFELFRRMVRLWPESFLARETWAKVVRRTEKSRALFAAGD